MNFGDIAHSWWDEMGPMRPLHKLNPQRIAYIKNMAGGEVAGKTILDIGCGGGIVSEALCRLGAKVTGIDVEEKLIETAKAHASAGELSIDYQTILVENVTAQFDIVCALEVVEHVEKPAQFIAAAAARVKDGGILILSTLNRTIKSKVLGKYAAEYLLRWVPIGTHDWSMFIKPHELAMHCEDAELKANDLTGLTYNPLRDTFTLDKKDFSINYFLTCTKG